MTCDVCEQEPCKRDCPHWEESNNVMGTAEKERYEAWRAKILEKLEKFDLEYPTGGSYVNHFLRYSRRY